MTEPTSPTPPDDAAGARPVVATPIDEDTACARCGYNLRGLRADGLCPECATPIARSLQAKRLRFADPDWLDKLRLGVAYQLRTLLLATLAVVSEIVAPSVLRGASLLFGIASFVLALMAVWYTTEPEPNIAASEGRMSLRRFIRVGAVIGAVCTAGAGVAASGILPSLTASAGKYLAAAFAALAILVVVITMFAAFVYLRRFARRLPDRRLARITTAVMWGLCLSGATVSVSAFRLTGMVAQSPRPSGGLLLPPPPPWVFIISGRDFCVGVVGLFTFCLLYVIVLFRYHAALRTVAVEARAAVREGSL